MRSEFLAFPHVKTIGATSGGLSCVDVGAGGSEKKCSEKILVGHYDLGGSESVKKLKDDDLMGNDRHGSRTLDLSRWAGARARCGSDSAKLARPRKIRGMIPGCEALDGRQLLSTVAASPAELSAPAATAVAAAAADLSALDSSGFARLEGELAQAESDSRVSAAEAGKLAQDEATLDRAIETLGQGRSTPSELLMNMQDVNDEIDHAFMGATVAASQDFIANLRGATQEPVAWRQLRAALSGVSIPPSVVGQTAQQMQVIARATHLPHQLVDAFWTEDNTLNHELGVNADANLGPSAADLGAVQVYFDGQINNFIKT